MTLSLLNNLTKLSNNVFSDYLFAHIDGGGTDTLKLASASLNLNLTQIAYKILKSLI
ncbi:hypothetical protein [uncultured Gammaproteobacteria bacterium]|jgi:hypothetical protein|nr:hypothetical protein [uncultured Gammaproteobacteria bacterium]CAC9556126.1 hypothetical protein [uncultured Gammaproteobacteria bacterium]CAC9563690.1 hypothetical protein [uncultured Gammaproteobacteria bacterium]CAC9567362.1 hypothetical protein [uncultured Gammaproteobacteria bacterium]CAC9589827.1 hypothetical protein [uncultured Gammaproteobacteria bacterium]